MATTRLGTHMGQAWPPTKALMLPPVCRCCPWMVSWVPPACGPHRGLRLSRTGSWGTGQAWQACGPSAMLQGCSSGSQTPEAIANYVLFPETPCPGCAALNASLLPCPHPGTACRPTSQALALLRYLFTSFKHCTHRIELCPLWAAQPRKALAGVQGSGWHLQASLLSPARDKSWQPSSLLDSCPWPCLPPPLPRLLSPRLSVFLELVC